MTGSPIDADSAQTAADLTTLSKRANALVHALHTKGYGVRLRRGERLRRVDPQADAKPPPPTLGVTVLEPHPLRDDAAQAGREAVSLRDTLALLNTRMTNLHDDGWEVTAELIDNPIGQPNFAGQPRRPTQPPVIEVTAWRVIQCLG